jgi:hypothetical protein
MSTIEDALKQYYYRTKTTPEQIRFKAKERVELLREQQMTVFIWFLGHELQFVELTEQYIFFRNALFRLKRMKGDAEFEHLCLLFLRAKMIAL